MEMTSAAPRFSNFSKTVTKQPRFFRISEKLKISDFIGIVMKTTQL